MNTLRRIAKRFERKPTVYCDLCTTNPGKYYRNGRCLCGECLRWTIERKI